MEKTFGEIIKEARISKKYEATKVAETINVTLSFITKIERYEEVPSYDKVVLLAKLLKLNKKELLKLAVKQKVNQYEKKMMKVYNIKK